MYFRSRFKSLKHLEISRNIVGSSIIEFRIQDTDLDQDPVNSIPDPKPSFSYSETKYRS